MVNYSDSIRVLEERQMVQNRFATQLEDSKRAAKEHMSNEKSSELRDLQM